MSAVGFGFAPGWLALAVLASAGSTGLAELELTDQLGRADALERHRGRPVLVMLVEAGGLRQLRSWEEALRERCPGLDYFRVADVPRGRGVTRERVLERLEGRVPAEVSILIDMEGRWATGLGLDTRQPKLLLYDASLVLQHRFEGRVSDAMAERVAAALASLAALP